MISFLELLSIYKWSLPASIVMAGALSLIGAQWTAREKSAQIFVLGQGASLGIILGLALNILMDTDFHGLNLVLGLSLGWITLVISDMALKTKADRNHIYLTLFVFFLSLSYLITSMTPTLESHVASSYFGDISVMSDFSAQMGLLSGFLIGVYLLRNWHSLSLYSFRLVNQSSIHRTRTNLVFDVGTLLLTTMSIQSMGYLYTMGSLFIATTFAAHRSSDLQDYTRNILIISTLGTTLGFGGSLLSTTLPTVPCILLAQMLIGILIYTKK